MAGEETTRIVQFVYHDGILHGTVMRYDKNQEIEYRILADGHMMVRELDHSTMNDNCATCQGFMADMEQDDLSRCSGSSGYFAGWGCHRL